MRAIKEIEEYCIFSVSCLCSRICIHKSILMSHLKATKKRYKVNSARLETAAQITSLYLPFQNGCTTPKTATFPLKTVLVVRVSMKEAIVYVMSIKYTIFENSCVDNEDNFEMEGGEQAGSEVIVMEIEDLRSECVRETEDHLNRMLHSNQGEVNKVCSRKRRVMCSLSSHFGILLVVM